jgi:2'-5' RNA ligase
MPAFLIGIDPPEVYRRDIVRLKDMIRREAGLQQQLDEPPHCTLVLNNFVELDRVDDALRRIALTYSPMQVELLKEIRYFPPRRSGAYMVHARVRRTPTLRKLQERIVTDTAPARFVKDPLLPRYLRANVPGYQYTGEELANNKRFGYPYVGENWIPHISLGILARPAFRRVWPELEQADAHYEFPLREITLFEYKKRWEPMKRYELSLK